MLGSKAWLVAVGIIAIALSVHGQDPSAKVLLPGLPNKPDLNLTDVSSKLQAICQLTGLCLGTSPPPAPSPAGCVYVNGACISACDPNSSPFIGLDCPDGLFCTPMADPVKDASGKAITAILAPLGQAQMRLGLANCTANSNCGSGEFCALAGDANTCLQSASPAGIACFQGGAVPERIVLTPTGAPSPL